MNKYAIIIIAMTISHSAFGAYVVDVTFNGDTNDIYSVEIKKDKGTKEFDAFLEIHNAERIGLCEQIIVKRFKVEEKKISLSIQATSTELHGFKVAEVKGKKLKYPILKVKSVSSSFTLHRDSWVTIGGGKDNEKPYLIMVRVRQRASNQ
jgi:hypothetical protein